MDIFCKSSAYSNVSIIRNGKEGVKFSLESRKQWIFCYWTKQQGYKGQSLIEIVFWPTNATASESKHAYTNTIIRIELEQQISNGKSFYLPSISRLSFERIVIFSLSLSIFSWFIFLFEFNFRSKQFRSDQAIVE